MNPAYSIIFFTTAAGAGYGLIVLLALHALSGDALARGRPALVALGLAGTLVTAGLLSSTLHLGHPERAWRALTQWRSSWLSREGVLALACYVPALVWAWQLWRGEAGIAMPLASAVLALATVYATSMIYASLKTVDAWHRADVPLVYLLLALASGALLWLAIRRWAGHTEMPDTIVCLVLLLAAGLAKQRYWHTIDTQVATSTLGTATGLGGLGRVSSLAWPHTEDNYLLKEMGYVLARRHATRLRRIALVCVVGLPLAAIICATAFTARPAALLLSAAVISLACGLVVERWLFFAEAKHAVAVYYGR